VSEGELIAFLVTLIGLVGAIVSPMLKLNSTITKLNAHIEYIIKGDADRDQRIKAHDVKLDHLENKVTAHDVTLSQLSAEHHRIHWEQGERE